MIARLHCAVDVVNGIINDGEVGEILQNCRGIDHKVHTCKAALEELAQTRNELVAALQMKDDSLFSQKLANREYNYRFLLNGLMQHNIDHLGQIAFLKNLLRE